ncbi:kinase domain protein [Penicillium hispanicum]|uniref:kinase domain protein n=1 Tax=Penicillium hispanicum TaxID=1080232 RepID=UPI00253FF409|nr:kinase domain protein [Penicillium hispanicum]KAJ5591710.1 kinase domain protein [Penicillium hispanicum]
MMAANSAKMSLLGLLKTAPYKLPSSSPGIIRVSQFVEEECAPHYNPRYFYPMQLYTVLASRYQVATKLGWGVSSTVWLAKDLQQWRWLPPRFVAIKVNANNYASTECTEKELRITEHISRVNTNHEGRYFIRTLLDSFDLEGPHGKHSCMVFDVLYEPLWMLQKRFIGGVLPLDVLKPITQMVIMGLDYLHTQSHIIHTDLKSDNILMALGDQSILQRVVKDEADHPLPQKNTEDRTIYLSRNNFGFDVDQLGRPVITDFGLSVYRDKAPHTHTIQPNSFRAPEVVLGAEWNYSVDIWNLGSLILELLCGTGPFDQDTSSPGSSFSEERHLAAIISLIGHPPRDILKRGTRSSRYFDEDGQFKNPSLIPAQRGLNSLLDTIEGAEKQKFLDFISRTLQWRPEERGTAKELLSDPWLQIQ